MDIEFFVFTMCVFQFRKFHENWAKHNKRNVEVWPWHSWTKTLKLLEKLTQHFASVVLLWNEIPENFWEPCQTSMAVFCENSWRVKAVNNFRMKAVSVCQGSKYGTVLMWYIRRSSFWSRWEKMSPYEVRLWFEIFGLPVYQITVKLLWY